MLAIAHFIAHYWLLWFILFTLFYDFYRVQGEPKGPIQHVMLLVNRLLFGWLDLFGKYTSQYMVIVMPWITGALFAFSLLLNGVKLIGF
ncbi:MAG: hypothetical protein RLZZ324_461 [Candidatus Parcubacteria bacterium]|jgi:hypothetical protein